MTAYSTASASERLAGLLDAGTMSELDSRDSCAVIVARGCIGGMRVWIAATDASQTRGALGAAEAERLCALFTAARAEPAPMFLLLDSAGAKVSEGLAALGAFRRLFREAMLTRLSGIPMFALLGRGCFGGSSMLAALCNARVYSNRTLLGVSGPAVIQALAGEGELDAGNAPAVQGLMGAEARVRLGGAQFLIDDELDEFRARARDLATKHVPATLDIKAQHARLASRLGIDADIQVEPAPSSHPIHDLAPSGYLCSVRSDVVRARAPHGSARPAFVGVLTGQTIGAATSWALADELINLHETFPTSAVILLLDAVGHASTVRDEQLLLSDYLTHLALTSGWLAKMGHRVVLWIPGHAAGAVYVAFAAPAERVSALPSAQIRILPQAAVNRILRGAPSASDDPQSWMQAGVVDALPDSRLESYAQHSPLT